MDKVMSFVNSPVGPKTVHFWGPAANWGLVLAAMLDSNKPPESISSRMTLTLFFYSCMFMRFAWRVAPRNYLLLTCHFSNASMQLFLFNKRRVYDNEQLAAKSKTQASDPQALIQGVSHH
uniref:Mitochondrial pyruvate carrier n=1 Tax=Strombidium rassoulzadegani TaxID=1082188 RepID=A0A7S3CI26_9SPIT|mmetsp:Transcript_11289/g.19005  ORF Transcript_11289/g.19005 Transcript_11289/m.19005 type:complete len:120 (+) Transcript_11289:25-384(+)|eukprot:CAMPEP_0168615064 /NCGR_PEP_ID=MMETSP0449_2-20121227/4308_1 /TAXON_ID=1082188 /ORGANISM="Strombidium rassoulzadegani, Strain ras09" /LENGTH=119 /DNA_ID=CAMNT_0008655785 /DNA_START=140 /DNA_END=499 /DNA_ORIENTATION=+